MRNLPKYGIHGRKAHFGIRPFTQPRHDIDQIPGNAPAAARRSEPQQKWARPAGWRPVRIIPEHLRAARRGSAAANGSEWRRAMIDSAMANGSDFGVGAGGGGRRPRIQADFSCGILARQTSAHRCIDTTGLQGAQHEGQFAHLDLARGAWLPPAPTRTHSGQHGSLREDRVGFFFFPHATSALAAVRVEGG